MRFWIVILLFITVGVKAQVKMLPDLRDTLYVSSVNLLSGVNDTLIHTTSSTAKTQTIYTECLLNYKYESVAYAGTDTIVMYGKYQGSAKRLMYILPIYITSAYSKLGQFPISWDSLDKGSPVWLHIPPFSTGNGILRLRFLKRIETW
jgi:hypothetical protein